MVVSLFKAGQLVRIKGVDKPLEFVKYKNNGWVEVLNGNWHEEYETDDILCKGDFYI